MHLSVLNNIQRSLTQGLGTDKTTVSVGLGVAIAYALPIPSEGQRDAGNFYVKNHFVHVDTFLAELNEVFLVEIQTALDVARTVWKIRYDSVYIDRDNIEQIASGNNPVREYLAGYSLDDEEIKKVLATGLLLGNQLHETDICKTAMTVRG